MRANEEITTLVYLSPASIGVVTELLIASKYLLITRLAFLFRFFSLLYLCFFFALE